MKVIPLQDEDQHLVELFRALGHPARLRILHLLSRRACICSEVVDDLPLSQATVSQHLKVLKNAGLIVGEVEGPAVCYGLAPGALAELHQAVAKLSGDSGQPDSCCDTTTKEPGG